MLNLASLVEMSAKNYPTRPAVVFNDRKMSYAELNGAANKFANALCNLGVKRGDKVALMMPNLPYFPICYFGILKAGATVVPFNVLFKGREVAYHLQDSDAVAFIAFEGSPELPIGQEAAKGFEQVDACRNLIFATADMAAPPPVDVKGGTTLGRVMATASPSFDTTQTMPDDTAVILYTSGTTGKPKGAELTHLNMWYNALFCSEKLMYGKPDDVFLGTLPLFHSFGQTCVMNNAFATGATMTLLPRFDPAAALTIMQRDGVTIFAGVPTMYWALLNYPGADKFDLQKIQSTLRLCVSGGSSLPLEVMRGFEAKYNVPIIEGYGLSETAPVATFNVLEQPRKPGSIGPAIWGTDVKCFDDTDKEVPAGDLGEIVIRGHNVMKGYYKRPQETAEAMRDEWFHTGDIARMDEDGYFYIVDRKKDMIIRGGFNVYPREIEEFLLTHPAVSLCAVVGVAHPEMGEEVKAFVVLKQNAQATEQELIEFCKANMAAYKYPRSVEFRSTLPMTATGKILKRELYGEGASG